MDQPEWEPPDSPAPEAGAASLFPSEIQLIDVKSSDGVTRRKVLATTGGALATALAGCGSPGSDGGDGEQEDGEPPGGESTADSENDPYAPEDNSTRGSGNRTVETRGPEDEDVDDGGEAGEEGDGGAGQDDDNQTGAEDPGGDGE